MRDHCFPSVTDKASRILDCVTSLVLPFQWLFHSISLTWHYKGMKPSQYTYFFFCYIHFLSFPSKVNMLVNNEIDFYFEQYMGDTEIISP